jgi:uncharacterized protein YndB with AHSA1/START domain
MNPSPNQIRLEPVRKSVEVGTSPQAAFRRFTEEIASWWPLETHSVGGTRAARVEFETRRGGRIYERTRDGGIHVWGTVIAYEPPDRLVFTWHPGREPQTAQEVELRFRPTDRGTRVEHEHRGWETLGDAAEKMRADYDGGWEFVLGRFMA